MFQGEGAGPKGSPLACLSWFSFSDLKDSSIHETSPGWFQGIINVMAGLGMKSFHILVGSLVVAVFCLFPLILGPHSMHMVILSLISLIVATSWNILI